MKDSVLSYRVLTYQDSAMVFELCKRFNIYLENNLIGNICAKKWDGVSINRIGYGCFDKERLIGYIGCLQAKRGNLVINDLSCGIVDSDYRGNGIATKLFEMANSEGDIVLDLTPSEQVYQMFRRHFRSFKDLSDYQLWFNCKRLKKDRSLICKFDKENITESANSLEKQIVIDNSAFSLAFCKVEICGDYCIVGFYTMKKKRMIKGFEITYVSNQVLFEEHYEAIIKAIAVETKSFFCFLDKRWLKNIDFSGTIMARGTDAKQYIKRMAKLLFCKYIKAPNRKLYHSNAVGEKYIDSLDYLYTEMSLYKDLN